MKKNLVFITMLLVGLISFAQEEDEEDLNRRAPFAQKRSVNNDDEDNSKKKKEKPPITDYKIINIQQNDTTTVDTTLTIQKDYKFNYLRRDDFGLQPINNVGQTYNSLIKVEERNHLLPLFGARARHFNFMEVEDIRYYNVPTPLTELYFRTTFEQGQQLDSFFTLNTSPQLNFSIAYKGNRSLGKYQNALTSTGNFRTTANYQTKNGRYHLKAHFVSQDLLNEENGGLSENGLAQYLSNTAVFQDADEFSDRGSIEVNFEDAESILLGKRTYLNHKYSINKKTDSSTIDIAVGHILDLTDKSFQYDQASANELFGESFESGALAERVSLEDFSNQLFLEVNTPWLGDLEVIVGTSNYNYGYSTVLVLEDGTTIQNRLQGDVLSIGGAYQKEYKGFQLAASGSSIVSGDFDGNYLNASAAYQIKDYGLQLGISTNSTIPNYNFLLYQSNYVGYNWQNFNNPNENDNFNNVETQEIEASVTAGKYGRLEASYTTIDNYTYFTKDTDSLTVPEQFDGSVELLKLKFSQNLNYGKLGIDNTIVYQNVNSDEVYRVPSIITRNSVYYQDHWFRRALYLQAGVTFKYYSEYISDGYDPVLSEFYTLNQEEVDFFENEGSAQTFGGFPQFDIFLNAKIRQTRIFFKVENFGEAFNQNREFSAPGYAPRDAVIRFGLVWNFFL